MQFSNIALALQVVALASAAAIPNGAELDKRSPIEVDVQQNNYCLPSNLNCPIRRAATAAVAEEPVDKREPNSGRPEAHAQVTHVDHRLPGKREPNTGLPEAHADVTDIYFHRPGKRDPNSGRPPAHADVTDVYFHHPGN
ncbi:hypothetical protein PGQ11_001921 [Apiospora arundinis]|uniref:Uncharacterized protein n=1 Tax=Apiospora arundinis TaxID=335852 RepID=A0ABR2JGW9_9PEZI